jgi:hypothetical protein
MCCGQKRAQARQIKQVEKVSRPGEKPATHPRPKGNSPPLFQYLGETGLTVMGPRSRRLYRFGHPGAVVAVDLRDKQALAAVSVLRQVK